jgi:hypothetical protein
VNAGLLSGRHAPILQTSQFDQVDHPMPVFAKLSTAAAGASTLLFAVSAFAAGPTDPNPLPEPSTWALVGLAAAIGAVVARRRK